HKLDDVLAQGFEQIEVALGQLLADALDDYGVIDGLGDVVVRRRLVGPAEGQVDLHHLRGDTLAVVNANIGLDTHFFDKDKVHKSSGGKVQSNRPYTHAADRAALPLQCRHSRESGRARPAHPYA